MSTEWRTFSLSIRQNERRKACSDMLRSPLVCRAVKHNLQWNPACPHFQANLPNSALNQKNGVYFKPLGITSRYGHGVDTKMTFTITRTATLGTKVGARVFRWTCASSD